MTGFVSNSDKSAASPVRGAIIRAVLAGGLLGAILSLALGDFERRTVFDSWQRLSPREIGMDNVAVVLVDDVSVKAEGAWPWSRYLVARLIENIGAAQPAAIGIDVYFTEADPLRPEAFAALYPGDELGAQMRASIAALPQMDEVLANVMGRTPTVLARFGTDEDGQSPASVFFNSVIEGTPPPKVQNYSQIVASIERLDSIAMSHAMVNGPPDTDGIVRRVPLGIKVGQTSAPGFALELARIASDVERLEWDPRALLADETAIAMDKTGSLAFKMGYFPNQAIYPAAAVARGQIAPSAFAGKVVLVGVGATGTFDIVATPLRNEINGVLVQAMAVDAIIGGDWLARPVMMIALEIAAALVLLGLVLVAGLTLRSRFIVVAGAMALALPFASWAAYVHANLLFDPVRPLFVGAAAAIALAITRYSLARAERTRLAAELVEQRVIASEQEGELKAARRIQMSMVPSLQALAKLDSRTEIGAVLEPAKSVGGDFYDAARISSNELLFVVGDVTGKGVPAALFMALSKSLSKSNLVRPTSDLGMAVSALNRDLMDEADEEMGLTLMVGVLDCTTGRVRMINAGHENPLLVRRGGAVESVELRGGPPLCVLDFPYPVEELTLAPGDTLVVITDGATEAANADDALFGLEGVIAALEAVRGESATNRVQHLAREVRLFEGITDPSDDLTIFAVRYLGDQ